MAPGVINTTGYEELFTTEAAEFMENLNTEQRRCF
jgi:hypothetical protein